MVAAYGDHAITSTHQKMGTQGCSRQFHQRNTQWCGDDAFSRKVETIPPVDRRFERRPRRQAGNSMVARPGTGRGCGHPAAAGNTIRFLMGWPAGGGGQCGRLEERRHQCAFQMTPIRRMPIDGGEWRPQTTIGTFCGESNRSVQSSQLNWLPRPRAHAAGGDLSPAGYIVHAVD